MTALNNGHPYTSEQEQQAAQLQHNQFIDDSYLPQQDKLGVHHTRLTVPNALSTARIIGSIPVGVGLVARPKSIAMFGALVALQSSDAADGYIARRQGTASEFGAQLDKYGDTVLGATISTVLLTSHLEPTWLKMLTLAQKGYSATAVARSMHRHETLLHTSLTRPSSVIRSVGMAGLFVADCLPNKKAKKVVKTLAVGAFLASAATSAVVTTTRHRHMSQNNPTNNKTPD